MGRSEMSGRVNPRVGSNQDIGQLRRAGQVGVENKKDRNCLAMLKKTNE